MFWSALVLFHFAEASHQQFDKINLLLSSKSASELRGLLLDLVRSDQSIFEAVALALGESEEDDGFLLVPGEARDAQYPESFPPTLAETDALLKRLRSGRFVGEDLRRVHIERLSRYREFLQRKQRGERLIAQTRSDVQRLMEQVRTTPAFLLLNDAHVHKIARLLETGTAELKDNQRWDSFYCEHAHLTRFSSAGMDRKFFVPLENLWQLGERVARELEQLKSKSLAGWNTEMWKHVQQDLDTLMVLLNSSAQTCKDRGQVSQQFYHKYYALAVNQVQTQYIVAPNNDNPEGIVREVLSTPTDTVVRPENASFVRYLKYRLSQGLAGLLVAGTRDWQLFKNGCAWLTDLQRLLPLQSEEIPIVAVREAENAVVTEESARQKLEHSLGYVEELHSHFARMQLVALYGLLMRPTPDKFVQLFILAKANAELATSFRTSARRIL